MGRREFLIYKRANPSFRNSWSFSPDSVFLSNAFRVRRWVSWFLPPTTTSARCGLAAPRTTTLLASASSDSRRSCLKKCWNFRLKKLQVREEAGSRVNFAATLRKWKYGLSNRFFSKCGFPEWWEQRLNEANIVCEKTIRPKNNFNKPFKLLLNKITKAVDRKILQS